MPDGVEGEGFDGGGGLGEGAEVEIGGGRLEGYEEVFLFFFG